MKLNKLLGTGLGVVLALSASASDLNEARIYINPGHGGWGPNDRPMATINYAQLDTLGFFETNTNLVKALSLKDELEKAGVGYVRMSRTVNGVVAEGDKNRTENDQYTETQPGESGTQQLVTLSVITQDVEANNMDYFISIHSNAATEGTSTNYPLLLYRGTDDASGNGLTNARDMARDAWQYINKNDITYKSAYTSETSNNSRGDISFYGSSSTNSMGYTGYLGVLKHGCDGFLSEGCFHTYQPERQRLLNKDYCKQEGVRYARAIRAWFGDNSETQGCIMGTVKDKYNSLENDLYNYKVNSVDAYAPLNNVTVVLQNADGQEVARYTTDNEYNGQGSYYRPSGILEYQGDYVFGVRTGSGTLYDSVGDQIFQGSFLNNEIVFQDFLDRPTDEVSGLYSGETTVYQSDSEYCVAMPEINGVYAVKDGSTTLENQWTVEQIYVLGSSVPLESGNCETVRELTEVMGPPLYYGTIWVDLPETVAWNMVAQEKPDELEEISISTQATFENVLTVDSYDKDYQLYLYTYEYNGLLYHFYFTGAGESEFIMYMMEKA